jgi:pimeloyl-ACP methyl ester carboxylesterase
MTELSDRLHSWRASGQYFDADGVSVWFRCRGRGSWLVCFHGFPTSSWDWHRVLPELEKKHRVLVFDFPGYGLSAKPTDRNYSILRQFDAAAALLHTLGIRQFHLLAHDMGDTVACELLYRIAVGESRLEPRSITLLNGGIYPDLHRPLPTQRLLRSRLLGQLTARFSSWRVFMNQYPRVYADPDCFDRQHYQEQWALMLCGEGRKTLARVACYMRERQKFGERWLEPLQTCDVPLQLLWGTKDPIALPSIADRLQARNPAVKKTYLADTGHYPQLESAQAVISHLIEITRKTDLAAKKTQSIT